MLIISESVIANCQLSIWVDMEYTKNNDFSASIKTFWKRNNEGAWEMRKETEAPPDRCPTEKCDGGSFDVSMWPGDDWHFRSYPGL